MSDEKNIEVHPADCFCHLCHTPTQGEQGIEFTNERLSRPFTVNSGFKESQIVFREKEVVLVTDAKEREVDAVVSTLNEAYRRGFSDALNRRMP